jgi:hypothetical protein
MYLIDIVFFERVCVLFFLLSPKTIPKTSVKTKQENGFIQRSVFHSIHLPDNE